MPYSRSTFFFSPTCELVAGVAFIAAAIMTSFQGTTRCFVIRIGHAKQLAQRVFGYQLRG
jgi:hypothetical protein